MSKRHKGIGWAKTKEGHTLRVWIDRRDNTALPTHWKALAGHLAGPMQVTKRMENRRKRRKEERRAGLAAWRDRAAMVARGAYAL